MERACDHFDWLDALVGEVGSDALGDTFLRREVEEGEAEAVEPEGPRRAFRSSAPRLLHRDEELAALAAQRQRQALLRQQEGQHRDDQDDRHGLGELVHHVIHRMHPQAAQPVEILG